jgi:hypothetical protein
MAQPQSGQGDFLAQDRLCMAYLIRRESGTRARHTGRSERKSSQTAGERKTRRILCLPRCEFDQRLHPKKKRRVNNPGQNPVACASGLPFRTKFLTSKNRRKRRVLFPVALAQSTNVTPTCKGRRGGESFSLLGTPSTVCALLLQMQRGCSLRIVERM